MFPVAINTCVHFIMYSYYFLASLGKTIQKRLGIVKQSITTIQIVRHTHTIFTFVTQSLNNSVFSISDSIHFNHHKFYGGCKKGMSWWENNKILHFIYSECCICPFLILSLLPEELSQNKEREKFVSDKKNIVNEIKFN